eukprot:jgi/Ulvmu1/10387/UM061_0071.1
MILRLITVISAAACAAIAAADAPPAAAAPDDCVPLNEALQVGPHVVFSRVFEAVQVPLNSTDRYTFFVPEDGEVVAPGDTNGIAGTSGIAGLFSAYGIDTRSPRTIKSSPVFDQVKGLVPYYIVRGAYSMAELRARSPSNHLTTMFDTSGATCVDPSDEGSEKASDGDIKVEEVDGSVGLTDDSTNTQVQAMIVQGDILTCGGSYVHLIKGLLNPCCNDRNADCTTAALDPKQVDTSIEATSAACRGTWGASGVAAVAAASAVGAAGFL